MARMVAYFSDNVAHPLQSQTSFVLTEKWSDYGLRLRKRVMDSWTTETALMEKKPQD